MNTKSIANQAKAAGFMRGTDMTALAPGTTFPVTWVFENVGSSIWESEYNLVYSITPHPKTEDYPRSELCWAITELKES